MKLRGCFNRAGHQVRRGEITVLAQAVGTTPQYLLVMGFDLSIGRWLNGSDEKAARRVCVIEDAVRRAAFPLRSPVGETLVIDHEPYEVVINNRGRAKSSGLDPYVHSDDGRANRLGGRLYAISFVKKSIKTRL